ncbi:hypothetical protein ACFWSF_09515 [Streptomyces sp. NPDC058611]|uniref:hypothetical protein n=1 Tax=unclassified Streptomyces TaxID=2593676 RepID=UPI0036661C74
MRLMMTGAAMAAAMVMVAGSPASAATVHSMCELRDGARLCYRATGEGNGPIVELRIKKIGGVDHARAIGWVPQGGQLWLEVRKHGGAPKRARVVTAPTYPTSGDPLMTTGAEWEYDGPGVKIRACTAAPKGKWLTCTRAN